MLAQGWSGALLIVMSTGRVSFGLKARTSACFTRSTNLDFAEIETHSFLVNRLEREENKTASRTEAAQVEREARDWPLLMPPVVSDFLGARWFYWIVDLLSRLIIRVAIIYRRPQHVPGVGGLGMDIHGPRY